jgi:hypothetical protein
VDSAAAAVSQLNPTGQRPSLPRMSINPYVLQPADVMVIKGNHWFSHVIEFMEGQIHLPPYSHVAIVSHTDAADNTWCIEARPGGIGWAMASQYLHMPGTLVNLGQPISGITREAIVLEAKKMLGTPYDWTGIAQDAERDLGLDVLWAENWQGTRLPPAHVVCSSFVAWLYDHFSAPAPHPTDAAHVEPGDWAQFIEGALWNFVPGKRPSS